MRNTLVRVRFPLSALSKFMTNIYLVRHGETEWNTLQLLQGHHDSPLTAKGVKQAEEAKELLRDIDFDRIFSSDLFRCQRTAEIIASDNKLAIQTSELLRECTFGRFEGKKIAEMVETLREEIDKREKLSEEELMKHQIHPEIESYDQIATRMLTFLREVAVGYQNQRLLVVSHAGSIRALLVKLGFATNKQLPHGCIGNAGFVHLESDGVDFFVRETHNISVADKS